MYSTNFVPRQVYCLWFLILTEIIRLSLSKHIYNFNFQMLISSSSPSWTRPPGKIPECGIPWSSLMVLFATRPPPLPSMAHIGLGLRWVVTFTVMHLNTEGREVCEWKKPSLQQNKFLPIIHTFLPPFTNFKNPIIRTFFKTSVSSRRQVSAAPNSRIFIPVALKRPLWHKQQTDCLRAIVLKEYYLFTLMFWWKCYKLSTTDTRKI